ncbi:MAG: F0F1 ATP synthase subunit gamma [Clostridiales Family XIII bacterium]|jgi:F0F1-type ATP synthase gamma subunit|nr:F0F1 ATP synthase subunit gamma [Clostridiales Family XIII bacterium]
MKIKTIVKVMNFHALLHIDAARRASERYIRMESEVSKIIDLVINNRNFILDKHALRVDESAPVLNIYIGSDYAFCGNMNTVVNAAMREDEDCQKVVIGKKLRKPEGTLLAIERDELEAEYGRIEELLEESVRDLKHSEIHIVYNHYYYSGRIALRRKKIYPIVLAGEAENLYTEDFSLEGDVDELLASLSAVYLSYELRIASTNSFAAENIMRHNATTESLKKIDERMEEMKRAENKRKKQVSFAKVLDSYTKKRMYRGETREGGYIENR